MQLREMYAQINANLSHKAWYDSTQGQSFTNQHFR